MQVTLDPADWSKLTRYPTAQQAFEWSYGADEDFSPEGYSADDNGWLSDSAMQYFAVAEALEHVQQFVPESVAESLAHGVRRVLCENGHVDELGAGAATDGHYWVSASPDTTREIWRHAERTDWAAVGDALRKHPLPLGDLHDNIESVFLPFIQQHLRILELAASRGWGLLGHCG